MENSFSTFLSATPTIKELAEHVNVSTNWFIVGTMLNLDQRRLQSIREQGGSDTQKMIDMFNLWLNTTPTASRRLVLETLRITVVGENTLADEYKKKLEELYEATCVPPSTKAVSILQRNSQSLNEALVSPVQVSQLLYCKRCISEATLDEMERMDQGRSLDDKKTTLLTAIQETVSSDYRKLKDIATVLSDVEETRHIGNEIMTKYEEKISQEDDSAVVQPQEVAGSNEDRASDILRNNYGSLSQLITQPVCMARRFHEKVISVSCNMPTGVSVSDSRAVLLKAVRDAVHSNYKHLELFVTVLRKFSETAHIGDAIFQKYKQCFHDGNSSIEEIECLLGTAAISQGQVGRRILIPRNMSPEFTSIRTEFGAIFYKIRTIITSKNIDLNELKKLLTDCFSDLKPLLENIENIDDILDVVKGKCNLIDVNCLQVIVQTFNITEGQEHLDSYKETVNQFCKSMRSRLCVDQVLQIVRTPTRLASETVVFILDWNPDTSTIEDIKNLLSMSLDTNFQIEKIGTGQSVVVTCYCPAEYTGSLIMAVFDKIEMLQKRGLKKFILGSSTLWDAQVVTDLLVQINDLKVALKDRDETIRATEIELATLKQKSESRLKEIEALQIDLEESQCIKVQNEEKINKLKQKILLQKRKIIDIEKSESLLDQLLEDAEKELESLKELSEKRLQEIEKLKLKLKKNNDSLAEQESTEASDTDTSIQEDEDVKWFQNGVRLFNPSLDSCKEVISKLEDKHEIMVLIASPSEIIQFLIPTILERKAIKQLTIYSSLTPEDILSFSSELSTNKSLTSLQIIHNSISDDGVFVLAEALQYNETLQYLYLNDNPDITSASAQSLAKLFMLSCLNLDNTNIDPNEVMDLMESLRTNNIQ